MNDPPTEPLSSAGLVRREAMLDELLEIVNRTRRTRRLRRQLLAAGGCACLALVLVRFTVPGAFGPGDVPQAAQDAPDAPRLVEPLPGPRDRAAVTTIVRTDPTVLERHRAQPKGVVVRMDDRMLLDTLASIGRPAGLIRFGNYIRLTNAVTDTELGLRQ